MVQLGLIGYPIEHSLSPWIHERFLKQSKIKGKYTLYEINPEENFEKAIENLTSKQIAGFNITVPYKQKIIPYLDQLDKEARDIGAVNTVKHSNGKWIGYNTDGKGYVRSLYKKYESLFINKNKKVLIIGAGGAARGIYYALLGEGLETINITNRTPDKAEEIIQLNDIGINSEVLSLQTAEEQAHEYDVIIQTTSVGMKPRSNEMIINLSALKEGCIVSDIVYQPIKTKFLKRAEELGAKLHYGHTMLLYQAHYAFELWTDTFAPTEGMDEALQQVLEGR